MARRIPTLSATDVTPIRVAEPDLGGREAEYVLDCLNSSWISSQGKYVDLFESSFAELAGARFAISVANGTVALHAALVAHGVGPGDEVIVPSLTYVATANAVAYTGATPVFVDSDPDTYNLDPRAVAAAVTPRTVGIIPVHLYGHPADMDSLVVIARQHGLFVIEDAAEAHGARYKGQRVGAIGNIGTFSFFGNKVLTTGEGGILTTNDPALARELRLIRGQGVDPDRRYWHVRLGYNYRMTNIAAAIGCAQVERFGAIEATRARIFDYYRQLLSGASLAAQPQSIRPWVEHSHWMFSLVIPEATPESRDEIISKLHLRGIETRPIFYPVHHLPIYEGTAGRLPNAEFIAYRGLSLPTHTQLSESDQERVIDELVSVARSTLMKQKIRSFNSSAVPSAV